MSGLPSSCALFLLLGFYSGAVAQLCTVDDCSNTSLSDPDTLCGESITANCTVSCSNTTDTESNITTFTYYCDCQNILYQPASAKTGAAFGVLFALYYVLIALVSKLCGPKITAAINPSLSSAPSSSAPSSPTSSSISVAQQPQAATADPSCNDKIVDLLHLVDEKGDKYDLKTYIYMNHPIASITNGDEKIMPKVYRNFIFAHGLCVGVALAVVYASVLAPQSIECPPPAGTASKIESDITNKFGFASIGSFKFDTRSTVVVAFLGTFTNWAVNQFANVVKTIPRFQPTWVFYHGALNVVIAIVLRVLLGTTFEIDTAIYLYLYTFIFSQLLGWLVVSPLTLALQWFIGGRFYKPKDQNNASSSGNIN